MLTSILSNATAFGDDVFSEDGPTNALESYVGELTGMENAVFVLSGTMGNQIALRCLLTQPPYVVICDRRSHIFEFECGMASIFSHARMIPVMPDFENQTYLTRGDIIPNIVPDDGDAHGAPTKVITLENTFWGKVMLVEEVRRISNYARDRGIKVHMDGARLWNAFSPLPPPLPHLRPQKMQSGFSANTVHVRIPPPYASPSLSVRLPARSCFPSLQNLYHGRATSAKLWEGVCVRLAFSRPRHASLLTISFSPVCTCGVQMPSRGNSKRVGKA
jgi:hypothetical protein